MNYRLLILLLVCVLSLPSCKNNFGNLFGPKAEPAVEFNYGPETRLLHMDMNMTMNSQGQTNGKKVPMASYNVRYSTKKVGSRIAWDVVLDNLQLFGIPQDPSPFYSVSFTSNTKGKDRADMVERDTKVADVLKLGDVVLKEIHLPGGVFKVGEPSIVIPVEVLQSENMEIVFPEKSPAYIFDGVKEINGEECYAFSYSSDVIIKQGGVEQPGSMFVSAAMTKNMLPVYDKSEIFVNDPIKNVTIKIEGLLQSLPESSDVSSVEPPVANEENDWRATLSAAPIVQVTSPVEFHYVASSGRFKAESSLKKGKKRDALQRVPFFSYVLDVDLAQVDEKLDWEVVMTELALMGKNLDELEEVKINYTTNSHGNAVENFSDTSNLGILTADDIKNDFVIPEGAYASGEVCMPILMGKNGSKYEYSFPPGAGYVFQGMKEFDSKKVAVFVADVESFVAKNTKTGAEFSGRLKVVRHYDYATMLPLWFAGNVELDLGEKGILVTVADFIRLD